VDPEPRIVEPEEGGDPACWAHLFEEPDEDDSPSSEDDAGSLPPAAS
jgi:hypothetical protein